MSDGGSGEKQAASWLGWVAHHFDADDVKVSCENFGDVLVCVVEPVCPWRGKYLCAGRGMSLRSW